MAEGDMTRLTAFKVPVSDIVSGKFIDVEGRWEPNYVITKLGQRVSRVRVMGIVVSKFLNFYIVRREWEYQ